MASNIKLLVAYDGTNYLGWQKTSAGPSIEAHLQRCLEKILQHGIRLQAASRTDAGVHAEGQVVNFFTDKAFEPQRLLYSLRGLLPQDIVPLGVSEEPADFHPTVDAVKKEYRYFLCAEPIQMPQKRLYAWHYPSPIDLSLMREASAYLVGTHDFAAFCNLKKKNSYEDTIRQVTSVEIVELPDKSLCFVIQGAHFLYKMVRNIVGTLAYVGYGKLPIAAVPQILSGQDRRTAGITAPAHGLTLHKVFY